MSWPYLFTNLQMIVNENWICKKEFLTYLENIAACYRMD
jgi:hypothetical protein